jgi:hypothetical protein
LKTPEKLAVEKVYKYFITQKKAQDTIKAATRHKAILDKMKT